MHMRLLMNG
uniref:Uncharacterized protein n=1 Tax=Rhizophora mucronata TaxID=61149 RepID=A0A2P2NGX6_RHIMU